MLLNIAIKNNNFKKVRKLIKTGVNLNLQYGFKATALQLVIYYLHKVNKMFTYLAKKALLNIQNTGDCTALTIMNGYNIGMKMLCKLGCHLFLQRHNNETEILSYMRGNYDKCAIVYIMQVLI